MTLAGLIFFLGMNHKHESNIDLAAFQKFLWKFYTECIVLRDLALIAPLHSQSITKAQGSQQ
jgi:hypothetical protein